MLSVAACRCVSLPRLPWLHMLLAVAKCCRPNILDSECIIVSSPALCRVFPFHQEGLEILYPVFSCLSNITIAGQI